MSRVIIPMVPADEYARREYDILFKSEFVYRMSGRGVHNPGFPHRVKIWSNTGRLNPHPGETIWTEFGPRGGEGQFLDPHGQGTDRLWSFLFSSEATAITDNGTNAGTPASGQVYADAELVTGQEVIVRYPDGSKSAPFVIEARPLGDPELVPVVAA